MYLGQVFWYVKKIYIDNDYDYSGDISYSDLPTNNYAKFLALAMSYVFLYEL